MRLIHKIVMLAAAGAITLTAVSDAAGTKTTLPFGVYVNVTSTATVALSGTTFTWSAIKPTNNTYALASSGPMTITGGMRTSPNGGTGSIVIMSPGNIQGQNKVNNALAIKSFALTCSGNGNIGTPPKYAAALTNLVANSTVPCATWGAGATTKLHFSFALYLETQNSPQDVYKSGNFSVIATAT